jgi:hypothetical protein
MYWSAGSYSTQDSAQREAARIADAINAETRVQAALTKAGLIHRVLVSSSRPNVKSALDNIGIKGAWRVRIETSAQPVVDNSEHVKIPADAPSHGRPGQLELTQYPVENAITGRSTSAPETSKMTTQSSYNPASLSPDNSESFFGPSVQSKGRWRSDIGFEHRTFQNPGLLNTEQNHSSVSLQSEYYRTWNDGDDIFAFVPFVRVDTQDNRRSHADIRELTWVHVADSYELRSGIRKVFWGVTESQHLVDVINQTDAVENPDGEEKLGQPMVNLSWLRSWGVVDIYWLMGFRERNFSGRQGRPEFPFQIETHDAVYESSAGQYRGDFAIRWVHSIGDLEFGLSHFSGTGREPTLVPRYTMANGIPESVVLIPHYNVIEQTGIDSQYFLGDWAFKAEAISRGGQGSRYEAATVGFEKTLVGIAGSRGDLGLIAEYLYDGRGASGPALGQDDIALGVRYAFNDAAATTALLVTLIDRESHEYLTTLEASSRLGERLKITIEASLFSNTRRVTPGLLGYLEVLSDPHADLAFLRNEDFIKLELIWYL